MKWLARIVFSLLFIAIMYYFERSSVIVFHAAVDVMIFSVGISVFAFSITSDKLKNHNLLTRMAPSLLMSSVFMVLHAISKEWAGTYVIDTNMETEFFYYLAAYFLIFSYIRHSFTYKEHFNFNREVILVFIAGAVVFFLTFFEWFNLLFAGMLFKYVNLLLIIGLWMFSFIRTVFLKGIRSKPFALSIISVFIVTYSISLFNETRLTFFLEHMFLLSGYVMIGIFFVRNNINATLFKKENELTFEIERLNNTISHIKSSEQIFRSLYENAPIGYQSLDASGHLIHVNNAYAEMLGYSVSDMLGHHFTDFMNPKSRERMPKCFKQFKAEGHIDTMFDMVKKNGNHITTRFVGKILNNPDGTFKQTHCILMDVSNEIEYQNKLKESEEKISSILESTAEGIIGINQKGFCTFINKKGSELLQKDETEVIGRRLHKVFHNHSDECKKDCIFKTIERGKYVNNESEKVYRIDDTWFMAEISSYPHTHRDEVLGSIITFRDVTSKVELSMSLLRMSYNDHLTGLYNRRYFEKELLTLDKSDNYPLTICLSDINGLKLINDAFGHNSGDELLREAAKVIKNNLPDTDIVARIGGDEFVIIMTNTDEEAAEKKIKTIKKAAEDVKVQHIDLSISFGYSTKKNIDEDIHGVYKAAEDAMYREKLLKLPSMRSSAINTVLSTLHEKDPVSEVHSRKVSSISGRLATALDLPQQYVQLVKTAGLLHDIGKIIIPDSIIRKEGPLTESEYEVVKKHPEIGYRILNSTDDMKEIAKIVLSHHEWYDGKGYPRGISEDEIPLLSRIITVADAFDAMTSLRTYRERITNEQALEELIRCSGTQFDPNIVKVFEDHFEEIVK